MARRDRRRSGGTDGAAHGSGFPQLPRQTHGNPFLPMELLAPDQLEKIHNASMMVLEEIGINFRLKDARNILKTMGADVRPNDARVRFDRDLIGELVAKAPGSFIGYPRNPERQFAAAGPCGFGGYRPGIIGMPALEVVRSNAAKASPHMAAKAEIFSQKGLSLLLRSAPDMDCDGGLKLPGHEDL